MELDFNHAWAPFLRELLTLALAMSRDSLHPKEPLYVVGGTASRGNFALRFRSLVEFDPIHIFLAVVDYYSCAACYATVGKRLSLFVCFHPESGTCVP